MYSNKIKFMKFITEFDNPYDKYQIIHVGVGSHEHFRHTDLRFCGISYVEDTFYIWWDSPADYYDEALKWDEESFIIFNRKIYTDLKQLCLAIVNDKNIKAIDEALG